MFVCASGNVRPYQCFEMMGIMRRPKFTIMPNIKKFLPVVTEIWVQMARQTDRHTRLITRFTTDIGPVVNNNNINIKVTLIHEYGVILLQWQGMTLKWKHSRPAQSFVAVFLTKFFLKQVSFEQSFLIDSSLSHSFRSENRSFHVQYKLCTSVPLLINYCGYCTPIVCNSLQFYCI